MRLKAVTSQNVEKPATGMIEQSMGEPSDVDGGTFSRREAVEGRIEGRWSALQQNIPPESSCVRERLTAFLGN